MPSSSTAQTWILTGSPENYAATRERGFDLIGRKERHRRSAEAMVAGASSVDARRLSDELGQNAEQVVAQLADELRATGVKVEVHTAPGDPAQVLIEVAEGEQADLIIVGNKGMSGSKRFVLGSVPNKLSHHAPCAVLIAATG